VNDDVEKNKSRPFVRDGLPLFLPQNIETMGHSHDDHHGNHLEPEQNEIGGPVVFALFCLACAVLLIYFLAQ
jgi:hypothetical protein